MRTALLAFLLIFSGVPIVADCCQVTSQAEQDAHDKADLAKQRGLIKELTARAEVIVIARTISITNDKLSGTFAITHSLKGNTKESLTLSWKNVVTVSCNASDSFQDILLKVGERYLLYVRNGQILRAGSTDHRYGELSYWQERRLIDEYLDARR